ncbi:MAG: FHA domain-containing protein [Ardenticatenaceae bacterium]|nr:FHA domain-containing protein [Anaerolineales bacterium]MCB8921286.1 FHA domain-containing protein [Ardenticatenaceae bacterium]MCB8990652.1 FHA domain-containing protein [Ardenticatenaceae bacterium]
MIKCPECGSAQYEGTLFCSECGRFLVETAQNITAQLPFAQFGRLPTPPPQIEEELELLASSKEITFFIPSRRERLQRQLQNEIRVGRADEDAGYIPELDLTGYDGVAHGVSRVHATIQLTNQGIVVVDLGSTNGTYLNNYRLTAQQPYLLASGDEILFGDLLVHIFFDL